MWGRYPKRPELGFLSLAGGRLALSLNVLQGALEWITLILGVLVGFLTLVRLLIELGIIPKRRTRRLRHESRRATYIDSQHLNTVTRKHLNTEE